MLIANMPLLCISSGSACDSGVMEGSFVLRQMGLSENDAINSIRVSTSILTSNTELESAVRIIVSSLQRLRSSKI